MNKTTKTCPNCGAGITKEEFDLNLGMCRWCQDGQPTDDQTSTEPMQTTNELKIKLEKAEKELADVIKSRRDQKYKKPIVEWYKGYIGGLNEAIEATSEAVMMERERIVEEGLDLTCKWNAEQPTKRTPGGQQEQTLIKVRSWLESLSNSIEEKKQ